MKVVYTLSLALVALLSASATTSALQFADFGSQPTATADEEYTGADADAEFDREAAGVVTVVFEGAPVGADADGDVVVGEFRDDDLDDDEVGADADMDFGTEHIFGNPEVRRSIIAAVNAKRAEAGLAALCLNFKLHNTAQSQASYMAKTNLISFISEDGFNPSQRGRSARFNSSGVAEIIGAGFTKADDLVGSWLKTPDSKAILLGNFTHIGPGYTVNATQPYVNYWVVDFAQGVGEVCSNVTSV